MEECTFQVKFLDNSIPVTYSTTLPALRGALQRLSTTDNLIAIDTETRALDCFRLIPDAALSPHLSCIRLIQMYDGIEVVIVDLDKILDFALDENYAPDILLDLLSTRRFVAHYALFDLQYFKRLGVKNMSLGCTQILARLIYSAIFPDADFKKASLAALVETLFSIKATKGMQASDWSVPNLTFEQLEYAALDVVYGLAVAEKLAPGIQKHGLKRVYDLYKAAQHPLAEMQMNGLGMDTELHRRLIDDWRVELYEAKKEVMSRFDLKSVTATQIAGWLQKNLSATELNTWPRTPTGQLSTDSKTLDDFSYLPIVGPFAEFQTKKTLSSTFGSSLLQKRNAATGRIHCRFNIAGARTGRLSSADPNLQNFPSAANLRAVFVPQPGWTFVCADYSQVEVRIAADVSGDRVLKGVYERGEDIYEFTASQVYGVPLHAVTPYQRKSCKPLVLGNLYGIGVKKYARGVGISEEEARRQIYSFHNTYPVLWRWQRLQAENGECTLEARTLCGKVRRLDPDNTYGAAMNVPIQGTAAEIMLYALVLLYQALQDLGLKARLVNTVHDEILVECPPEEVEQVSELVEKCMILGYKEVIVDASLNGLVDVTSGANWGAAKG